RVADLTRTALLRSPYRNREHDIPRTQKVPHIARGTPTLLKLLVPSKGLEPPHPCEYMDLNHARLPIPPRWQVDSKCSNGLKAAVRKTCIRILTATTFCVKLQAASLYARR